MDIHYKVRTDNSLLKDAKEGGSATTAGSLFQTGMAQALIRLLRYLGMQSQLTMRAICSFFLDVTQHKHMLMSPGPQHKNGTCKNE